MAFESIKSVFAVCIILSTLIPSSIYGFPTLLFSTYTDIRTANISQWNSMTIIVKDLLQNGALDFIWEKNLVCWTNVGLRLIQCAKMNGTTVGETITLVNSSSLIPDSIACDWYSNKLYWTDSENKRIEVTSVDGEFHRKVLIWKNINTPRAIALVPMKSLMFWTDWGEGPRIERASMDGDPDSRKVIITEDVYWPNGLAVDYENEVIYWTDSRLKFVAVMDYDGQNRRNIIKSGVEFPFAITMFDRKLYWSDWKISCIYTYDTTTSYNQGHPRKLFQGEYLIGDIEIWDPRRQPAGDNPCKNNNGNCSHLCLLRSSPPGYSCACPIGIKLIDNYTCSSKPEILLLISQQFKIFKLSLDSPDYTNIDLPIRGIKYAIAIDFDPVDEMVYWTDIQMRKIKRAFIDGSNQENIVTVEVGNPEGIAIDWVARNMYWTDSGIGKIQVARLNGTSRKILIKDDLIKPRAIAVAPQLGWMFWSDWSTRKPKIERSNLDGSERIILIAKNITWPNGIALDIPRRKMYWCDAKTDKLEVSNMDGTERKQLLTDTIPHPFGLSLLDDYLYWTDWERLTISRVHKITGTEREVIIDKIPYVMGIKAIRLGSFEGSNPCAVNNGGCSHLCLNKPKNQFICACPIEYELKPDLKTCFIPEAFLLFSRKDFIGKMSMENASYHEVIPVSMIRNVSALDVHLNKTMIYWADMKLKTINRAFINGSKEEKVVDLGLENPQGLAIDWISQNIYWSDIGTQRIELFRLQDSSRKVLIWQDIIEPHCLAVDPIDGFIYWSEWGNYGTIERSELDGSSKSVLLSDVGRTNGLTIDYSIRKLYWADPFTPAIDSFNLRTLKREKVIYQDIFNPYGVTQYLDYIYWTDWVTGVVERANKTTGLNRTKVHENLDSISDMMMFHSSRQTGINSCSDNNGGCSHICIALPGINGSSSETHKCACPTHYTLSIDKKNCNPPTNYLMYSTRNQMSRFLPYGDDCPDIVLRVQGLKNVKSIEFDPITQHFYWIDGKFASIRKTMENETESTVMINGGAKSHPFDLALDPIGRLLFWSCSENEAINVTRLDNDNIATLGVVVKGDGEKPRHIAVNPEKRLLFWIDIGEPMKVMQSAMDGKDRILIATDLKRPTGLTVDTVSNLIFWADESQIEMAEMNGKSRQVLTIVEEHGSIAHLAVLNEHLYWFNRETQLVERIDKITGQSRKSMLNHGITDLITVRVLDNHLMETHSCSPFQSYGGCSHFCIGGGTTSKCSCPQHLVLSDDKKTCSAAPACGTEHFTCTDSSTTFVKDCIPLSWKCDGQNDCPDGSDEIGCPTCERDQFRCQSGQCIDLTFVCDGTVQCQDGGDEAHCCQPGQFRCTLTSVCVAGDTVCDGWDNCADGSDESSIVCEALNHSQDNGSAVGTGRNTFIIVVLVLLGLIIIALLGFYYCRKKLASSEELPDILHDSAGDPLSPRPGRSGKPMLVQKNGVKDLKSGLKTVRMSTLTGNNLSSTYDRHITGASSSAQGSSLSGYPHETLNPPPSPATTANSTRCSSSNNSRYKPYRHYRSINQPPPPTPCSTDVCDESDCNYPARYRYDEPFPPPPTPRSVYHSDTAISCPPSPGSRSSTYFSPLPPPPSPVP